MALARFSPKIEIINHFDNLINRVDIDIDLSIEKYNNQQLLRELLISHKAAKRERDFDKESRKFQVAFYCKTSNFSNSWPESTKVVDYLNQVRMKTIEELKKAQEDSLEYYKLNSSRFKIAQNDEKSIEELRSELFAEKFYFQVHFNQSEKRLWAFSLFTFSTDFYMSPSEIDSLEKLINAENEPFSKDTVFDQKMVLIGLLYKYLIENLSNFPNHVIHVRKYDVLNIKTLRYKHYFTTVNLTDSSIIDLSNLFCLSLERHDSDQTKSLEINIEGLDSLVLLEITVNSSQAWLSIKNLPSLKLFGLWKCFNMDETYITTLLDQIPTIEKLYLHGNFSYINLDKYVNLKKLLLGGTIEKEFNFELLKNLCNQIEELQIYFTNIDDRTFFKLFDGLHFPYLQELSLDEQNIKKVKKNFIDRFPMLKELIMTKCDIEIIENDAFSNLKQLEFVDLSSNKLKSIGKNLFSNLKNLNTIDLKYNKLKKINPQFFGIKKSVFFIQDDYRFYRTHFD